jgi:hypothetical protein
LGVENDMLRSGAPLAAIQPILSSATILIISTRSARGCFPPRSAPADRESDR